MIDEIKISKYTTIKESDYMAQIMINFCIDENIKKEMKKYIVKQECQ